MKKSVALSGINAGNTAICSVGEQADDLFYRGYNIEDLARACCFEEVYFLLLNGKLPTERELNNFSDELFELRTLPLSLLHSLEQIPKSAHPMNVMQMIVSFMGCIENKAHVSANAEEIRRQSRKLISVLTPALLYWYQFSQKKSRSLLALPKKELVATF